MLTTSDPELDKKFRLWRQHSMSVPDTVRHKTNKVVFESYPELGYNYRMTDIQAAVGREQLLRLPEVVAWRRQQVERYRILLSNIPGVGLPEEPEWARSNWQSFCVRLPSDCDQQQVMQTMLDAGVATRRGVMCAHREPAYQNQAWSCGQQPGTCDCRLGTCVRLSESEKAQTHSILLPLFHQMTEGEQDVVVDALRVACAIEPIGSAKRSRADSVVN